MVIKIKNVLKLNSQFLYKNIRDINRNIVDANVGKTSIVDNNGLATFTILTRDGKKWQNIVTMTMVTMTKRSQRLLMVTGHHSVLLNKY